MVTLAKLGDSAVKFTFTDSDHYLTGSGEIEVPVNSLLLVLDESDMVTFKKVDGDPFISFLASNSNLGSKSAIETFYKENMVGATGGGGSGSSITSGDVETMIATALEDYPTIEDVSEDFENYYDKDEIDAGFSSVTQDINAAVSGKADTSAVTAINSSLTAHTANTDIHTTSAEKSVWNGKQDALTAGSGISINNNVISCTVSGGGNANIVEVTQAQYDALVSGGTVDPDALYVITDAEEINLSGYAQSSAVTAVNDALTAHTANTTVHTTSAEKTTWNGKQDALVSGTNIKTINNQSLLGSGNIDIQGGGGGGISSAQCQTMIEDYCDPKEEVVATALNDLNDRVEDLESGGSSVTIASAITSSSTNDEAAGALATYNAITAATTGGGATYSAGTNISIDTANTISCTIPISGSPNVDYRIWGFDQTVGSISMNNILVGTDYILSGANMSNVLINTTDGTNKQSNVHNNNYGVAIGAQSFLEDGNLGNGYGGGVAIGYQNTSKQGGVSIGYDCNSSGHSSVAIGRATKALGIGYVAIGQSAIASGTTKTNINNQIKVDTNNQVYIKDKTNTTDVCIQDAIAALGGLKFVKLTQSEYDQLATKDANTLYIITNVVS